MLLEVRQFINKLWVRLAGPGLTVSSIVSFCLRECLMCSLDVYAKRKSCDSTVELSWTDLHETMSRINHHLVLY